LALMQNGDCANALPEFKSVLSKRPHHLGAAFNLGNCLERTGHTEEAAQALASFRKMSDEEARRTDRQRRGWFLLQEADKALEAGNSRAALNALDEAIRLDPESAGAHAMRGQVLEAGGDDHGAAESFKKAAELDSSDPIILVETGRLMGKTGRM